MEQDAMRSKLDVKMYCAKHPDTELKFSPDSKVGANSAYEINIKVLIHPCEKCKHELEKLKNAMRTIRDIDKDK
jgi:hypothetical protein